MRVLLVVPTYWPAVRYGGTITSDNDIAQGLASRGHNVEVYTTNVDGNDTLPYAPGSPIQQGRVTVHYFSATWSRRLYLSVSMARAIARNISNFDVITVHSAFTWPPTIAALLANWFSVPYIFFPHGMLVKELIRARNPVLKKIWLLFGRVLIERAVAIRVTSDLERLDLTRFGWTLPPFIMLPNPVSEPAAIDKEASLDIRHIAARQPLILYFGRLSWKKGLDRLLCSLACAPQAQLAIVGPDDENISPKLLKRAESLGVGDRVIVLPRLVLGADTEHLFRAAQLFILASLNENFGNTVVEAMRRGVPTIVSPEVGASEIVRLSGGGLVVEGNPKVIGQSINQLLGDGLLRSAMGKAGAAYVINELSTGAIAERLEREILQLTAATKGGTPLLKR